MKNKIRISDAEWTVMRVLWSRPKSTANDVIKALDDKTTWKPKTIRTLINRLLAKEIIGFVREGREYRYFPVVSEEECLEVETDSFLKRAGTKALKPILAAFIEEQDLSHDDINELKHILNKKREV